MTANRIKELRDRRGLTQHQLGSLIGADKNKVSRIETGETDLKIDVAVKIAKALDATLADVVGIDDDKVPDDAEAYDAPPSDPLHRLTDGARNRTLYRVKADVLDELGIRAGDVLLVDGSSAAVKAPRPLSALIVQLPREMGSVTLLRQFVPPALLITNSRSENREPISISSTDAHIRGVVISRHQLLTTC